MTEFITRFEHQLKQLAFQGNAVAVEQLQELRHTPDKQAKIVMIREIQKWCREISSLDVTEDYLPAETKS